MSEDDLRQQIIGYAKKRLQEDILYEAVLEGEYERDSKEVIKRLTDCASDSKSADTDCFDQLIVLAADYLRECKPIPDWLSKFVADVLEGKRKRPSKKGRPEEQNWERDYKIAKIANELVTKYGIAKYGKGNTSKKITATEAIVIASGKTLSDDKVINAIKKFSKL